ncbi:MAG: rhodanese-like domain-containing protein [Bacillota bacterium]|nr:rhodanese-like domain-containing protein [Bacillota bacterium]
MGYFNSIDVNVIDGLLGRVNLIDVREPYEYKSGHLPTAKNIPMNKIISDPGKYLDRSKRYYIICQSGGRSLRTCTFLWQKGYDVINVAGGTGSYRGKLRK